MDGQTAAEILLDQIQVLENTQHYVEGLLPKDYDKNMKRLATLNETIAKLQKVYDKTLIIGLNLINQDLENSVNALKAYNDALDNDVAEIAMVTQIIKFLAQAILVAGGI
ncbi:hypothetical protein E2R16_04865 [Acinetobacter seifertii]|uniref:Uncharacterized protein n=1 Tax=Acinetobacter seifertii TaxID=1530123 RepID=A0A5E9PN03_9GAMM|nr:hypothetical protein [Acinetobacter seifertii]TEU29049.1 hypothetical protein E2R16_04865 [Acinetobacter seifertii]